MTHFVAISETDPRADRRVLSTATAASSRRRSIPTSTRRPTTRTREDFYLVVSALVPYKRIDLAVDGVRRLGRRLIVIGRGRSGRGCEAMAGPTVEFLGWQPDEVIRDHYRRCRALLFPGEEDFGIVPVEAMACGAR